MSFTFSTNYMPVYATLSVEINGAAAYSSMSVIACGTKLLIHQDSINFVMMYVAWSIIWTV